MRKKAENSQANSFVSGHPESTPRKPLSLPNTVRRCNEFRSRLARPAVETIDIDALVREDRDR